MTSELRIGFVGFGEAATCFAKAFRDHGVKDMPVFAAGPRNRPPYSKEFLDRAAAAGARPVDSLEEVVRSSDVVFSAVVVSAAEEVGAAIGAAVSSGQLVVDINSTAPDTKIAVAEQVAARGGDYVDVALIGSVKLYGPTVPLKISGGAAKRFADLFTPLGLVIEILDERVGTAATLKMVRSLAMKSMGMVILESVLAGAALGIRERTFETLCESMDGVSFGQWARMGMLTNRLHARRRADEVDIMAALMRANGVDPVMATAAKERLERLLELDFESHFEGGVWPEDYRKVLPLYEESHRSTPDSESNPAGDRV